MTDDFINKAMVYLRKQDAKIKKLRRRKAAYLGWQTRLRKQLERAAMQKAL